MPVRCSTCLENLNVYDDLTSTFCGHVFHLQCLTSWLETGKKTCPQCRSPCGELRRIFMPEGEEISVDPDALQSKIDSLSFKIRTLETEKRDSVIRADKFQTMHIALLEEFQELEKNRNTIKSDLQIASKTITLLQKEAAQVPSLKRSIEEIQSTLKVFENTHSFVKGTIEEAKERFKDFNSNTQESYVMMMSLKRDSEAREENYKYLKKESKKMSLENRQLKSKLIQRDIKIKELDKAVSLLSSDLHHVEEAKRVLEFKNSALQQAMDSPSGDPRLGALNRLMSEFPMPNLNNESLEKDIGASPFLKTKANNLIGLEDKLINKPGSSVEYKNLNIMKKSRRNQGSIFSQPLSSFNKLSSSDDDKYYNGLGGHDKVLEFSPKRTTMSKVNNHSRKLSRKAPNGISRLAIPKDKIKNYFSSLETP